MLFGQIQRSAGPATIVATSSGAAVAALVDLRLRSLPRLIEPPTFIPRTRALYPEPAWLSWLKAWLDGRAALAALAALALLAATTVPAWAALQPNAPAPHVAKVASSAGVTGTSTSRLEDLGLRTLMRDLPLVQYLRVEDAVTGHGQNSLAFGAAVREATIAQYGDSLGAQALLPQLDGALRTKEAAARWIAAAAEAERLAAERAAAEEAARQRAAAAQAASSSSVSGGGAVAGVIPGVSITFYDCLGGGFCGGMANGQQVFAGAAACSTNLALGTRFTIPTDPTGRTYICLDRGAVAPTWVDVWFYDPADGYAWQSVVGSYGDIYILQ